MQLCDVRSDLVHAHPAKSFDSLTFDERCKLRQIPTVRGDGVRCQSTLRRQVLEKPLD